jgi:hypothetical protein
MEGNPVSILKTETDILEIYATIYFVIDYKTLAEKGLIVKGCGVALMLLTVYAYAYALPSYYMTFLKAAAICSVQASGLAGTAATRSGSGAAKYIKWTAARLGAVSGNDYEGIYGVSFYSSYGGSNYDAWYFKTLGVKDSSGYDVVGETIGAGDDTEDDFVTDWHLARDFAVYIDAVEQTEGVDYTVNEGLPFATTMNKFMGFVAANYALSADEPFGYNRSSKTDVLVIGSTGTTADPFNTTYYENLISEYAGITGMSVGKYIEVACSNDFINWTVIDTSADVNKTVSPAGAYQHYKYWRFRSTSASSTKRLTDFVTDDYSAKNIHFASPPAAGAVITADYNTLVVPKDSNHVFDFAGQINFDEFVPEVY